MRVSTQVVVCLRDKGPLGNAKPKMARLVVVVLSRVETFDVVVIKLLETI